MSGTAMASRGICLRPRYAVSGTDVAYAAMTGSWNLLRTRERRQSACLPTSRAATPPSDLSLIHI
eukprot:3928273-Rhodomonas_salina.1